MTCINFLGPDPGPSFADGSSSTPQGIIAQSFGAYQASELSREKLLDN
jgi:hypothetical protein